MGLSVSPLFLLPWSAQRCWDVFLFSDRSFYSITGDFNSLSHSHFKNWLMFHHVSFQRGCFCIASAIVWIISPRGKA